MPLLIKLAADKLYDLIESRQDKYIFKLLIFFYFAVTRDLLPLTTIYWTFKFLFFFAKYILYNLLSFVLYNLV